MAVALDPQTEEMLSRMRDAQAKSLETTTQVNEAKTKFDTSMQALKMEHSSKKAYIDALKAAANNIAQMGRAQ